MTFEITIDSTNTPISEGETLTVDYTVENTGASADTQDIDLNITSPTSELRWETEADWDAAQDRVGVVNRDYGTAFAAADLRLGWDPDHGVVNQASNYWPLGAAGGTDLIGGADGTVVVTNTSATGVLGMDAFEFDGTDDLVDIPDDASYGDSGSFSVMGVGTATDNTSHGSIWGNLTSSAGAHSVHLFSGNDTLRGVVDIRDDAGSYDNAHPLQLGNISAGTRYHHLGVYDEAAGEGRWYLDGVVDTDSIATPWPGKGDSAAIGQRHDGGDREWTGTLSHVIRFPDALTQSEADDLYAPFSGDSHLDTATQTSDAALTTLESSTTQPANTSISITVNQDTDGDGTAENTETVSVSDGEDSVALSNFTAAAGADYWVRIEPETTDETVTPVVNWVSLS